MAESQSALALSGVERNEGVAYHRKEGLQDEQCSEPKQTEQ